MAVRPPRRLGALDAFHFAQRGGGWCQRFAHRASRECATGFRFALNKENGNCGGLELPTVSRVFTECIFPLWPSPF